MACFVITLLVAPLALGTLVAAADQWRPSFVPAEDYTFEAFVIDFNRSYPVDELTQRRTIFEANLQEIFAQNSDPARTWAAGVSELSDRTRAELLRRKGRSARLAEWQLASSAGQLLGAVPGFVAPERVDWREKKDIVTPVKDQGGCGSCWAFAATETLESHIAIQTGKLFQLAPQEFVSCVVNTDHCGGTGGCEGATAELAFNYTRDHGAVLESAEPYKAQDTTCKPMRAVAKVSGYVKVPPNDHDALVQAVASHGPVAISVDASWGLYHKGIFEAKSKSTIIDHAVQLVGYGTEEGVDYWLVRNSWGSSWGEEGYIRLRRYGQGKEPCGIDTHPGDGFCGKAPGCQCPDPLTVCGTSGVLSDSSLPVGGTLGGSTDELEVLV